MTRCAWCTRWLFDADGNPRYDLIAGVFVCWGRCQPPAYVHRWARPTRPYRRIPVGARGR